MKKKKIKIRLSRKRVRENIILSFFFYKTFRATPRRFKSTPHICRRPVIIARSDSHDRVAYVYLHVAISSTAVIVNYRRPVN